MSTSSSPGTVLETALVANPDDLAAHAAYADWLSEQGDPRGEFIQVQLALEDPNRPPAERKELTERESALLQAHGRQWLGQLAPFLLGPPAPPPQPAGGLLSTITGFFRSVARQVAPEHLRPTFTFARGWLHSLEIVDLSQDLAQAMAGAPQLRLLQHLLIDYFEEGEVGLHHLSKTITHLRILRLGAEDEQSTYIEDESVIEFIRGQLHLEEIYSGVRPLDSAALFQLPLPHLRALTVNHLDRYPLKLLVENATLGRLTKLSLWPHAIEPGDEGAYITRDDVRALVFSPHLQSLTHLELHLTDIGDDGCQDIVQSGILRRLKVLDLSGGRITDAGARTLADCPDLRHLDFLNLHGNILSSAGIAALLATNIRFNADSQHDRSALEDQSYLYEGDIE